MRLASDESDGSIRLEVQRRRFADSLTGSHLLVATGRTPNSDTLNLAAAGVQTDDRRLHQGERAACETTAPGIYALGDIKGGPAFTHISYDDFRIIRTNLIEKGSATTTGGWCPTRSLSIPQLGRIGLTETEARAQKRNIRVAKMPMTSRRSRARGG